MIFIPKPTNQRVRKAVYWLAQARQAGLLSDKGLKFIEAAGESH